MNKIEWIEYDAREIFKEGKTYFSLRGLISVDGKAIFIAKKPRKGLLSNISDELLNILIKENLLTKKPKIIHRISCEPGSALNNGTVVTVMIKGRKREECSTIDDQDVIRGYLLALASALDKFVNP